MMMGGTSWRRVQTDQVPIQGRTQFVVQRNYVRSILRLPMLYAQHAILEGIIAITSKLKYERRKQSHARLSTLSSVFLQPAQTLFTPACDKDNPARDFYRVSKLIFDYKRVDFPSKPQAQAQQNPEARNKRSANPSQQIRPDGS
jgi:hypothetical protein